MRSSLLMTFGHDVFGTGPMGFAAELLVLNEESGESSSWIESGQTYDNPSQVPLDQTGSGALDPDLYSISWGGTDPETNPEPSESSTTETTTHTGSPLPDDELSDPDSYTPAESGGCSCTHQTPSGATMEELCKNAGGKCYQVRNSSDEPWDCECLTRVEWFLAILTGRKVK